MITRRELIKALALIPIAGSLRSFAQFQQKYSDDQVSEFARHLSPLGRILEMENWYVWCTSPIFGPDNRVHLFFSRWPADKKMGGWISCSEIAHAVADHPEGPYELVSTVLAPRGEGFWDATTCHNPHIQLVDGTYCLFYMGNSNRKTETKRVGVAISDSLYGPWTRMDQPLIEPSAGEAWDNHCTTNPSFIRTPEGTNRLYYKSWNSGEYNQSAHPSVRGNRKYGMAESGSVLGPYVKYRNNPIIDFSQRGENAQLEDAFVYFEGGKYKMLARDMGFFDHEVGLYLESDDGISWSEPKIAYFGMAHYCQEPVAPPHLKRYGRLERPQLLLKDGKPAYLFTASQGGKYMTSSAFVLKIT